MRKKIKISHAEKFLIELLFTEKKFQKTDFKIIDYKKLVKIASSHLMLPSLYVNLKSKNLINYIPKDLRKYLKQIFLLNKERNQHLLSEIKEISKILNAHKIEHVFLKGSANIISNLYTDFGERMIGDIDFLVKDSQSLKTFKIFKKLGYETTTEYDFFMDTNKHYTRQSNIDKIFPIEIHKRLLLKNVVKHLETKKILNNKVVLDDIYITNSKFQLLHNIYNYQINDYGNSKLSYSYRSLYDTYMLLKTHKIDPTKIILDKYINNYIMILKELKIPLFIDINYKTNIINLIRFRLKKKNKLYYNIDSFLVEIIKKIKWKPKQIKKLISDKKYRNYIANKIKM